MHKNDDRSEQEFGSQFLYHRGRLRASLDGAGDVGVRSIILACLAIGKTCERDIAETIADIGGRHYIRKVRNLIDREIEVANPAWVKLSSGMLFLVVDFR